MTGVFTADLVAAAVVAAARAYGDCPERAVTSRVRAERRALSAAISAMARLEIVAVPRLSRILGVGGSTVHAARQAGTAGFRRAEAAAREAVRAALVDMFLAEAGAASISDDPSDSGVVLVEPAPGPRAEPTPEPAPAVPEPAPPPRMKARVLSAGKVRAEILACLGEEPSTGPELVQLVGVGEGAIREALAGLREAGRVTCTALTAEGWKAQTWSVAEGGEAA